MLSLCKKQGLTKQEFLHKVAKIEGIYVPSFYTHTYARMGRLPSSRRSPACRSASKSASYRI